MEAHSFKTQIERISEGVRIKGHDPDKAFRTIEAYALHHLQGKTRRKIKRVEIDRRTGEVLVHAEDGTGGEPPSAFSLNPIDIAQGVFQPITDWYYGAGAGTPSKAPAPPPAPSPPKGTGGDWEDWVDENGDFHP